MADDLMEWSLAWARYVREHGPVTRPVADRPDEPEPDDVCDDERDADAAVGVVPAPLLVYGDAGAQA